MAEFTPHRPLTAEQMQLRTVARKHARMRAALHAHVYTPEERERLDRLAAAGDLAKLSDEDLGWVARLTLRRVDLGVVADRLREMAELNRTAHGCRHYEAWQEQRAEWEKAS